MSVTRDFKLTKNFALREFSVSASYPALVEPVPDELMPDVIALAVRVLQPIRDAVGPVGITSGYRPKRLNDAVGSTDASQHRLAQAADIYAFGMSSTDLFQWVQKNAERLYIGQVIHYPGSGFVHVAIPGTTYKEPTFFVNRNGRMTRV